MKKLIMWSGGIDSTYVLAKALKDTDDEIFAHHIHLVNRENRHVEEKKAIIKLIPKLHAIRGFRYTESVVDHSRLPDFPYDMAVVCFESGAIMKSLGLGGVKVDEWGIGTNEEEGHWWERWNVISPATKAAYWCDPKKIPGFEEPPPFKLHPLVPKIEEIGFLNENGLLLDCWYCRTPVNGSDCGNCKACHEVDNAISWGKKCVMTTEPLEGSKRQYLL